MIEMKLEIVGTEVVITRLGDKWPKAALEGLAEGVHKASNDFADDVAAHTPVKSGRARANVRSRLRGQLTGVIDYNYGTAFYMKFVEALGPKPHYIEAKRSGVANTRRGFLVAMKGDGSTKELARIAKAFRIKKKAIAFVMGGQRFVRNHVYHPGFQARHTLTHRLAADQAIITNTIWQEVEAKLRASE